MADSGQRRLRRRWGAGRHPRRPEADYGRAAPGVRPLPRGGSAVYLVDIRLESAARLSPADVRGLLSRAALPGDGVEHIYVQPSRPSGPAPPSSGPAPPSSGPAPPSSGPAPPRDAALCLDAVLFLSHLTLTESERAADALLERCTTRGLRLRRLSAVPLTLLVELLALER
ncbi:hypothetical protein [Streptomyces bacillaris]|uniref:hypothetical protein n=1 Tax=Streptomyces bacillaris TaxID=68179 RepID=UPI00345F96C4